MKHVVLALVAASILSGCADFEIGFNPPGYDKIPRATPSPAHEPSGRFAPEHVAY